MHPLEALVIAQKEHKLIAYKFGEPFVGSYDEYAVALKNALIDFRCICGFYDCLHIPRTSNPNTNGNNNVLNTNTNGNDYLSGYLIGSIVSASIDGIC